MPSGLERGDYRWQPFSQHGYMDRRREITCLAGLNELLPSCLCLSVAVCLSACVGHRRRVPELARPGWLVWWIWWAGGLAGAISHKECCRPTGALLAERCLEAWRPGRTRTDLDGPGWRTELTGRPGAEWHCNFHPAGRGYGLRGNFRRNLDCRGGGGSARACWVPVLR